MGKDKKTPVVINDVEYMFEDMTQEQQMLVNHVADLDRKIASSQFNLDQLSVGKQAFIKMLEDALAKQPETIEEQRMSDINPVEYGKLVNAVENLEHKVNSMDNDIKRLVAMAERSKGSLWALMGVASVAGAFISYVSDMIFRK